MSWWAAPCWKVYAQCEVCAERTEALFGSDDAAEAWVAGLRDDGWWLAGNGWWSPEDDTPQPDIPCMCPDHAPAHPSWR